MIRSRPWLFAASFACALACSAPAEGSFPGRNGELAYHGRASAQGLLYFRAADGDRLRRLRVPGRPAEPAFSPLGRRIAFASNGAIWVMQADGSDLRRLTPPDLRALSPAWSPDGASIAFTGGRRGERDLYRISLDGRGLRQITSGTRDDGDPAWSSRGTIAFVRRTKRGDGDVYTVSPSGGSARRITGGRADDAAPVWSPLGRRIAFTRRDVTRRDVSRRDVTRRDVSRRKIMRRAQARRRHQLFVMRAGGSGLRRLTSLRHGVTALAWSPDGRQIAFATGQSGRRALHRLQLRGREVRRLASGSTDVRSLSWQPADADPVIAAAGDVACDPLSPWFNGGAGTRTRCHMRQTSDLLLKRDLWAVLLLGDGQYEDGVLSKYLQSFHPTWGRVKSLIRPVRGNHEIDGAGHFDYFNGSGRDDGPAGPRPAGYYSFDVGAWHIVGLNSQCAHRPRDPLAPGCEAGSEQERWLRADLAANARSCTLAFWHHPLISSRVGVDEAVRPLWQALYDAGVDVVLTGHDHAYERFAPLNAAGVRDGARGIRQFVVGTGGRNLHPATTTAPDSEIRNEDTYGVLQLRLRPHGYFWTFLPEAGGTFTDSGANACH